MKEKNNEIKKLIEREFGKPIKSFKELYDLISKESKYKYYW